MLATSVNKYKTITQLVVENLRERILMGDIKPGERIPQDEIAKEFNISKIPIREALQLLKGEGYVSIEVNKGAFASVINADQIDELFSLKILIEADLLAASLPFISVQNLEDAKKAIENINTATSPQQWIDLNITYYNCLYSGIERPQTEEMIRIMRSKIERFNYVCFMRMNKAKQYLSLSKLLEYCIERKVDRAVEQLKQHLGDTKNEIKVLCCHSDYL